MALDNAYVNEIFRQLGYFAAWAPDTSYDLGDYGSMDGKQFEKLGNIKKWISPKAKSEGGSDNDYIYYTSTGSVNVTSSVGAKDASGSAEVSVNISFSRENSIFFLAQRVTTIKTGNLERVGDKLVDVYKQKGKDWRLSYVWIEEIKQAAQLQVVISQSSSASIKLSGRAQVGAGGIVGINFGGLATVKKNAVVEFRGDHKTPLLRLYEVKDPITKKAFYTEYR
ncbi:MAG: hypothetical protein KC431_12430 [Myxococcales bacterium]|nr:hypothetical protein [Myxococcales bacterium]MCA9698326.1 hypothetical protein [Myxococcales bacterium]